MAPSIESFLTSLKLHRTGQSLAKREVREKERPRASNYDKFTEIDLSSPLGKYIVTSSGLTIQQMNPAIRGYKSLGANCLAVVTQLTLNLSEEYNAEIDTKCPGTIKSLKNSNAFMDIRGKWNSSYKLSRFAFIPFKTFLMFLNFTGRRPICGPTHIVSQPRRWRPRSEC